LYCTKPPGFCQSQSDGTATGGIATGGKPLNNLKSACGGVIELKINNILIRRFIETPEIETQTQFL
jgi:hypothetical protein